jgi:hypothetical protein
MFQQINLGEHKHPAYNNDQADITHGDMAALFHLN